jgi:hypothetical protein
MSAELVCREMTPANWHDGASIFEVISIVRLASQAMFRTAAYPDTLPQPAPLRANNGALGSAFQLGAPQPSPPPELVTLRRTAQRSGAFVLVAKDQSPLFQIVG